MAVIDTTTHGFYVYIHRRATDGVPFYVGKGKGLRAWDVDRRTAWWKRVMAKYGHTVEIAQDGLQEWAAFELERDLIALYGRRDLGLGQLLNLTDGGEGASGQIRSEESNQRLRNSMQQYWSDPLWCAEHADRMSVLWDGPMRDKICASRRKNQGRAIMCLETGVVFASVIECVEWVQSIGYSYATKPLFYKALNCTHGAKTCDHHFADPLKTGPLAEQERRALIALITQKKAVTRAKIDKAQTEKARAAARPIRCIGLDKVFSSMAEAAEWFRANGHPKATYNHISNVLAGRGTIAYGYHWEYVKTLPPV